MTAQGSNNAKLEQPHFVDPESILIVVKTLTHSVFELRVHPQDTIRSVKKSIQRNEGIQSRFQNLLFRMKELRDTARVCDYGIQNGDTVTLVLSVRGGPIATRRFIIAYDNRITLNDLKELLQRARSGDAVGDGAVSGSKVSVLFCRDSDFFSFLSMIENEDGTYSPMVRQYFCAGHPSLVDNSPPPSPPSVRTASTQTATTDTTLLPDTVEMNEHLDTPTTSRGIVNPNRRMEDTDMAIKMSDLRQRMAHMRLRRQMRHGAAVWGSPTSITPRSFLPHGNTAYNRMPSAASTALYPEQPATYKWLSSRKELLDNLRMADASSTTSNLAGTSNNNHTSSEGANMTDIHDDDIALRDKHRIKSDTALIKTNKTTTTGYTPPLSYYSETKGMSSHTKQFYARIHGHQQRHTATSPCALMSSAVGMPSSNTPAPLVPRFGSIGTAISPMWGSGGVSSTSCGPNTADTLRHQYRGMTTPSVSVLQMQRRYDLMTTTTNTATITTTNHSNIERADTVPEETTPPLPPPPTPPAPTPHENSNVVRPRTTPIVPRCRLCKKRLNITNVYDCRCGDKFCATHRYAELHQCTYDYKLEGRRLLALQNPTIKAAKLQRF